MLDILDKQYLKKEPKKLKLKKEIELNLLSIVTMLFDINAIFGETKTCQGIKFALFYYLSEEFNKMYGFDTEKFFKWLHNRFILYKKAFNTPHPNGPPYMIGKTFAELLNVPKSAAYSYEGCLWFTAQSNKKAYQDIFNQYEIVIDENTKRAMEEQPDFAKNLFLNE